LQQPPFNLKIMQIELFTGDKVDPITDKLFVGQIIQYNSKTTAKVLEWDFTHVLIQFPSGGKIATPKGNYISYK
jgi:hypothetical protein